VEIKVHKIKRNKRRAQDI